MELEFDLDNVEVTEFGVGRDDSGTESYVDVPVGAKYQSALLEIVDATWDALKRAPDGPQKYEPSEKHGSTEYLYLPISDELAAGIRELHESTNLNIDVEALDSVDEIFCYSARLTDRSGDRLTALRRASHFKGIAKKRDRLARVGNNSLDIIEDTVFKLDNDFDLLIDSSNVHVLRPSGFKFVGKLKEAILHVVPSNIAAIRSELSFVEFDGIEEYASSHSRAARYLASIRSQSWAKNIRMESLIEHCGSTGVEVHESGGKLHISGGHEMGFLEVLDRRRFEINLADEGPEKRRATGRSKIND